MAVSAWLGTRSTISSSKRISPRDSGKIDLLYIITSIRCGYRRRNSRSDGHIEILAELLPVAGLGIAQEAVMKDLKGLKDGFAVV